MLDYACRASAWSVERLQALFRANYPEDPLGDIDTDEFWGRVATNLKAERLRLVFVADRIPNSLRSLIEFLDRNMDGMEVYGVEVKRYSASDAVLLTSDIIGNSLGDKRTPVKSLALLWNEASFSESLRKCGLADVIPIALKLKSDIASLGIACSYCKSRLPAYSAKAGNYTLFTVSRWWKKSTGYICTAEFYISRLLSDCLDESWTEARLRSLLTNIPNKSGACGENLIWDTKYYLYMDLRALSSKNDLERFEENLKALCKAIVSPQRTDIPPANPDTGN